MSSPYLVRSDGKRMRFGKISSGIVLSGLFLTPLLFAQGEGTATAPKPATVRDFMLAPMAEEVSSGSWKVLERYDRSITREDFLRLMNGLFDPFDGMKGSLVLEEGAVTVYADPGTRANPVLTLHFAESEPKKAALLYRSPEQFKKTLRPGEKPLAGLRVAIDPADIGGSWGQIEDRSIHYPGYGTIQEGDINLINGLLLKQRLEELGATVRLTRETAEPAGTLKAEDLMDEAARRLKANEGIPISYLQRARDLPEKSSERIRILAEMLLTKTYETRARAWKLSENFQPDITLVLQHNATASSADAKLAELNRNVFFVPGAYTPVELKDPRQRYQLFQHLLQQSAPVEAAVAGAIARAFEKETGYPPVLYGDSATTRVIADENSYVYARNIAVTREHSGPVVVVEPYFMNEKVTLQRLLAGDYDGKKTVAGKSRISIHREYVGAVVEGMLNVYAL
jgi:N-acetylmuramoyl-L-alanine amidase